MIVASKPKSMGHPSADLFRTRIMRPKCTESFQRVSTPKRSKIWYFGLFFRESRRVEQAAKEAWCSWLKSRSATLIPQAHPARSVKAGIDSVPPMWDDNILDPQ